MLVGSVRWKTDGLPEYRDCQAVRPLSHLRRYSAMYGPLVSPLRVVDLTQ